MKRWMTLLMATVFGLALASGQFVPSQRGGYGPGDGSGYQGVRPQDGTGYGPGPMNQGSVRNQPGWQNAGPGARSQQRAGTGICDQTGPKGRTQRGTMGPRGRR